MWTDISAAADNVGKAVAKRLRFFIKLFAQLIVANRHDELLITSFIMQTLQIADASDDRHAIYERPQLRTIIDEGTVILLYRVLQRHAAKATGAYYKKFGCQ